MQGISGTNMKGAAALRGVDASVHNDKPIETSGGEGGLLNNQKDAKESAATEKFGDLWKQIQTQYGAKAEKPREIKKTLGKDDFLRIMITQMKNQDPTSPFKAEEMATQMAQFASVEQLQNMNQSMSKMANANQPLERLAMTGLIGKTITVDRERFVHTDNETSSLGYSLSRPSKETKLKIISEQGETILEKDLGPQKAGDQTFVWDGAKTNGMSTKGGNYIFKIEAVDEGSRPIAMETKGQAKVVGVSFEGPEGTLLVGNPNSPQKITMRNVIRIDTAGGEAPAAIPGARSMASALQAQGLGGAAPNAGADAAGQSETAKPVDGAAPKSGLNGNWISFEKGVGSKNLDPASAGADARKALEAYESAKSAAGKNPSAEKSENEAEKGFPNGFSSGDNQRG